MRQSWTPLSQRSSETLREQAAEYRRMAETARTIEAVTGLLRLAIRFEALAETHQPGHVPSRRHASTISPSISGSAIHAGSSASEAIPVTT